MDSFQEKEELPGVQSYFHHHMGVAAAVDVVEIAAAAAAFADPSCCFHTVVVAVVEVEAVGGQLLVLQPEIDDWPRLDASR